MSHRGSLLCLPSGIWAWPVAQAADIDEAALAPVFAEAADIELFLLGTGRDRWIMPDALRGRFRDLKINRRDDAHRHGGQHLQYPARRGPPRRRRPDRGGLKSRYVASWRTRSIIAKQLVRAGDKDRFLATLFAPQKYRRALYALYAFNLEVARMRELAREPMPGEIRLQWWRDVLAGAGRGEVAANPVAAALRDAVVRYRLPPRTLTELIDARSFDLYDEPMASLSDLERYAAQTSSALIELAARILC